jgi:hypothetical protein
MKKLILFVLVSLMTGFGFCTVTIKIISEHKNGNIRETGYFKGGSQIAVRIFDEDGLFVKQQGKIPNGFAVEYHPNNTVSRKEQYSNNKLVRLMTFFASGQMRSNIGFENDKCFGKGTYYYQNSQIREIFFCRSGLWHGKAEFYSTDGKLLAKENYVKGNVTGVTKFYYPNDVIKETVTFVLGKRNGPAKVYDKKGRLKTGGSFLNDKLHGEVTDFYLSGKKKTVFVYDNGVLIKKLTYKKNGKLDREIFFK